jgi:hypothetical protein
MSATPGGLRTLPAQRRTRNEQGVLRIQVRGEARRRMCSYLRNHWAPKPSALAARAAATASLRAPRGHNPQQINAVIVPVASSAASMEPMKRYGVISTMEDISSAGASDVIVHTETEVRQASTAGLPHARRPVARVAADRHYLVPRQHLPQHRPRLARCRRALVALHAVLRLNFLQATHEHLLSAQREEDGVRFVIRDQAASRLVHSLVGRR